MNGPDFKTMLKRGLNKKVRERTRNVRAERVFNSILSFIYIYIYIYMMLPLDLSLNLGQIAKMSRKTNHELGFIYF